MPKKVNTSICAVCEREMEGEVIYPFVKFCLECRQLSNFPTLVSVVGQLREDVAFLQSELKSAVK